MPEFKLPENFESYPEARKKAFLTMKELKERAGVLSVYSVHLLHGN